MGQVVAAVAAAAVVAVVATCAFVDCAKRNRMPVVVAY